MHTLISVNGVLYKDPYTGLLAVLKAHILSESSRKCRPGSIRWIRHGGTGAVPADPTIRTLRSRGLIAVEMSEDDDVLPAVRCIANSLARGPSGGIQLRVFATRFVRLPHHTPIVDADLNWTRIRYEDGTSVCRPRHVG